AGRVWERGAAGALDPEGAGVACARATPPVTRAVPPAAVPECPQLAGALHPLHAPPTGPGWNRAEIADLPLPVESFAEAAVLVGLVPRADGSRVLLTRRTLC